MIEFSGVRSSCDIVARKADLSRSADSAASLASAKLRLGQLQRRDVVAHRQALHQPSLAVLQRDGWSRRSTPCVPSRRMFSFSLPVCRSGWAAVSWINCSRSRPPRFGLGHNGPDHAAAQQISSSG